MPRKSWRILRLVIPVGFVLSIGLLMAIGVYTLKANDALIQSFKRGEVHFRSIATAATEASSYVKRAEGHLLMYLALNREIDRIKVPRRMASLRQQLAIIDKRSHNPKARELLAGMTRAADRADALSQEILRLHDQSMAAKRLYHETDDALVLGKYHEQTSLVRKLAVQLASLEIDLQNATMHRAIGMAESLREAMGALIAFAGLFALGSGTVFFLFIVRLNREIKGRLQYEQELNQSQARLRAIFDATSDSALLLAPDCTILYINHIGARRRGAHPDTLAGSSWCESLEGSAAQRREAFLAQVFATGQPTDFEERIGAAYFSVRLFPVLDSQGQVAQAACFSRDITSGKLAEEKREKLEAQLRQSQKMEAVGTLASGIAHDFNNLLAVIMGFGELAREDAKNGHSDPAHLDQILESAGRGKELVQRILAFSRKEEPELSPLDLNEVTRASLAMLRRLLPQMISIETDLAPELPPVLADATQMEQVIMTLATNARDAMPQGGTLGISTRLSHGQGPRRGSLHDALPNPHVLLTVSDTGAGLSEDAEAHLFEPFFTTKEVGKGTGLGLAVAYGIMRNHGGTIELKRRPEGGTICELRLPIHQEVSERPERELPMPEGAGLRGDETILLADDVAAVRQVEAQKLERMGYRVLAVSSGEEALNLYRERGKEIDLVILDLGMPGMGGRNALKAILGLNPKAKVLIASGYAAEAQVREAMEAGAVGYAIKPFHLTELLGKVRFLLDGK
ncbi:MAG: response regulator [Desulfarculaceae bacterium]|nr:response regulator [Desulfarculaceae bacterium]